MGTLCLDPPEPQVQLGWTETPPSHFLEFWGILISPWKAQLFLESLGSAAEQSRRVLGLCRCAQSQTPGLDRFVFDPKSPARP